MSPGASRVYLDHNATSPLRPEAREAMRQVLDGPIGNPSSMHAEGRAALAIVERAREQVAELIRVPSSEIVFTSCGSEAIAAAVRGVCDRAPERRRRIVLSATEHSAVLESARLASRRGFVVVTMPCDGEGRVDLDRFLTMLGEDVALAALHWANNETGVVQPVEELGRACRAAGIPFLVDAVQAVGKLALDPREAFVDLLAVSAHKIGGPPGGGALVVRSGLVLAPLIGGAAQERRRRGGTPAVAVLAGFGAAAAAARPSLRAESSRLLRLRTRLETRLRQLYPEARFHGQGAPRLPNTLNFAIPGLPGEILVIALDLAGFAVSTGSACASGAVQPSHVIRAMGFADDEARGAVRISLGWSTSVEHVEQFLEEFPIVVEQVRAGLERGIGSAFRA
jgi:cysteine desulfurase